MAGFPPSLIAGHEHSVHGEPGPNALEGRAPPEVRGPPLAFPHHQPTVPGCVHHAPGLLHTRVPVYLIFLDCPCLCLLGLRDYNAAEEGVCWGLCD